jgi:hypothetical protein
LYRASNQKKENQITSYFSDTTLGIVQCAGFCGAPWKGAIPQWEGSPTRQFSLRPVAIGAVAEETKRPKPSM